uniref:Phosphatidate cytidylyltransferase n=1 Tax=Spongospora subterranea TaxID=70186 RepID=A0A0H5R9U3_9EUKA|eukprot:CRZ10452.1 hypothetical protein [Spongospora subterranea]
MTQTAVNAHPTEKVHGPWYLQRIPVGFCLHLFFVFALNHFPIPLWLLCMGLVWQEVAHLLCGHFKSHSYKVNASRLIALAGCLSSFLDWHLQTHHPHLLWKSAALRSVAVFVLMVLLNAAWKDIASVLFFLLTITASTQVFICASIQDFTTQISIVAASDAFQYFIGKRYGRYKPVPDISPNKTIEGYFGGFILCNVLSLVFAIDPFNGEYLTWYNGLLVCGIIGDLSVSSWKRFHMLKDTGDLLSSHGGVLDRLYSHVAGFLWTVIFMAIIGHPLHEGFSKVRHSRVEFVTKAVWAVIWARFVYERGTRFYRKKSASRRQ